MYMKEAVTIFQLSSKPFWYLSQRESSVLPSLATPVNCWRSACMKR